MANVVNNGGNGEPNTAPQAEKWYNLSLGSSFKDNPSTKFSTLRYEFKPASIDKSQAGSLHKNKDNRVTVEFSNNQSGKPKVSFEGSSEDYKENDGVLFFDGETFRLERLHRAVKRLRHVRMPGESAAIAAAVATASTSVNPAGSLGNGMERSPPLARMGKSHIGQKAVVHSVPVEVERIDIGGQDMSGMAKPADRPSEYQSDPPNQSPLSPDDKGNEMEEHFHMLFGDDDSCTEDDVEEMANETNVPPAVGFDRQRLTNHNDSDDEIADVDVSENEGEKGPNAAEALRAQVNAGQGRQQTSSSSESSGSESRTSGSGSGSSSSNSEASDDNSASSGGDIDI